MKLRTSVWLKVCLYTALSAAALAHLSAASTASPSGDIPSVARAVDTARPVDAPALAKNDVQILQHARAANEDVYSSLQSFVCDEEMTRFKGDLSGQSARALDTVTAKLSFERGVEEYTNIHQNNRVRPSLSSLPGAWSEGEFGTLLLQTQQLITTQQVEFDNFADLNGEAVAIYHFDVPGTDSPWDLTVAGHHYRLPFRTNVWIAVNTGEILKLDRTTTAISPETHISEIRWGITLDRTNLNGKTWLLPSSGTYAVLYNETHRREWNNISFSGYQRYGAEASLKFE